MTPTCDMEVTLSASFKTLDHHEVMEYGSGHELVDGFLLPESSK